ncbi:universal stress protein [Kitasatospora sp. NPDC058965]|uniref:universal stress protein n=1 Tax=Kitasatospora sp. NPDC058965 TaxID=3346682 RepID=UPI0036AFB8A0
MNRRPVVAAIDTSARSRSAARWAAAEALRRATSLHLVHTWPFLGEHETSPVKAADLQTAARALLHEAAADVQAAHPTLTVSSSLIPDAAVDGLLAAGSDAQLLVLGTRGLGGFHGLLVGSVSLAVAARAELPVVLVREEWTSARGDAEVVVGLDVAQPAEAVLDFAFREAALRGARVRVVHGWDLPPMYGYAGWVPSEQDRLELGAVAEKLVTEAVAPWRDRYPLLSVETEVRLGGGANALVHAADGAALTVVGRAARPHPIGARLGSVAHAVVHHAQSPVAVVPHD